MGETTPIRWTDSSWNPMVGCTQISPGCAHCYALRMAERMRGSPAYPHGFDPEFKPHKLDLPRKWRDPRRIFVNSMSDLYHPAFPDDQVDAVWGVMTDVPRHTYQLLTKRPERMADHVLGWLERHGLAEVPPHIWLGASIEADRFTARADVLRRIPCPVRFISAEPLLGPLPSLDLAGIDWLIVGGESGRDYRPMEDDWARDLRDRAIGAGVAFFFKQHPGLRSGMGEELDGVGWSQYPEERPGRRTIHQESARGPVPQAAPPARTLWEG
jgi:protein gp37